VRPTLSIAGKSAGACGGFDRRRKTINVSFWRQVATLAMKDLRVEFRSREILYTMTFFAAMVVLIFSFAFIREGKAVGEVVPGILWVAVVFAGTLGLSRAFGRERESDTMRGLLLSPTSRTSIFFGKAVAILLFILLVEAVLVPLIGFLFGVLEPVYNADGSVDRYGMFDFPHLIALTLLLGNLGFAVVGTVFAAMLMRARSRDVLLPVVLYPILVPMLIAATKSTFSLFEGDTASVWYLIQFMAIYDGVFIVVALWVFESLVIE
jgi:heme exporter protein B